MNGLTSANISPLVSRNFAWERFASALKIFIGKGRRYSVKQAANGSGVPDRLIECFMLAPDDENHRKPQLGDVLSLMSFLGPEFASDLIELAQLGAFHLPEPGDEPLHRAAVDAVQDAAELSTIAERGGNVHELRDLGSRMMTRGAKLRAGAGRQQLDMFERKRVA